MWDLPGPGVKPVSPALAGGFSTTALFHPKSSEQSGSIGNALSPFPLFLLLPLLPILKDF